MHTTHDVCARMLAGSHLLFQLIPRYIATMCSTEIFCRAASCFIAARRAETELDRERPEKCERSPEEQCKVALKSAPRLGHESPLGSLHRGRTWCQDVEAGVFLALAALPDRPALTTYCRTTTLSGHYPLKTNSERIGPCDLWFWPSLTRPFGSFPCDVPQRGERLTQFSNAPEFRSCRPSQSVSREVASRQNSHCDEGETARRLISARSVAVTAAFRIHFNTSLIGSTYVCAARTRNRYLLRLQIISLTTADRHRAMFARSGPDVTTDKPTGRHRGVPPNAQSAGAAEKLDVGFHRNMRKKGDLWWQDESRIPHDLHG